MTARTVAALAAGAVLIVLLQLSGGDAAVTARFYDPASASFPMKDSPWLAVGGHTAIKWMALAAWAGCVAAGGSWRRGAWYALSIALVVSAAREASPFSCPWDLPSFGGSNPASGRCLPAAHPLSGFAFLGVAAALHLTHRRSSRAVLGAAVVAGLVAGAVQVARGAHFVSHVLWTAWIAAAAFALLVRLQRRT